MDMNGIEDIKLRLDQIKVVAVTCLGITSPLLANKRFDACIMDEAGQTTLPVSLGPLMFASVFVLVGDHYQLPPLVQSTEAQKNGMGASLFCRLSEAHPQAISALQSQYRMSAGIMELSNSLIYDNRLRCGSTEVENAKLKCRTLKSVSPWLKEVLNPYRPVIFINTDMLPALEAKENKTVNNPIEAHIIAEVCFLHRFASTNSSWHVWEDIGIITPYNSRANLICRAVSTSVEIHTIDKYQGRDKDCILVSFVRSSENPRNCVSSLLGDWHRINVALTHAKKKLIMVGSCKTLSKVPLLKLLIEKFQTLFIGYDLLGYIDGSKPCPLATLTQANTIRPNPSYILWTRQDQLILNAVIGSISPTIISFIAQATTSRQAWKILANTYAKPSRGRIKQIKNQLKNSTKGSLGITEFMQTIKTRADDLALLGALMDEEEITDKILDGLGDDYKELVRTVQARDTSITFEELHEKLLNFEASLQPIPPKPH
ncbi:hypothetical protein F0562_007489 [Nyssa sinensis]|uniref:DNA replication ATP-dependent helicase/nuclease n=1 Tax=Nyssa sinensis TaxID=561372 RepID=A0A5J5A5T6_9ASTE|nr:hypothetical protein F0562_007489 [Nyssa sinensis]